MLTEHKIEPWCPVDKENALHHLGLELIRADSLLKGMINPVPADSIAKILIEANCYYSNLIEGHDTSPILIRETINSGKLSNESNLRNLQIESKAHILTNKWARNAVKNGENPFSSDFIKKIHRTFYDNLPEAFHLLKIVDNGKSIKINPGEFRTHSVIVKSYLPPKHQEVEALMRRYCDFYSKIPEADSTALAAAHHRLTWIHPFQDGNGRTARILSEAQFLRHGFNSSGLWSISRGLAIFKKEYLALLSGADNQRLNDYDGRGFLSDKRLFEFCEFFLKTCVDQIEYIRGKLDVDSFNDGVERLVSIMRTEHKLKLPESIGALLKTVFHQGEITRGDAHSIIGLPERTSRRYLSSLVDSGLLVSDSVKGSLRIGFPDYAVACYFPRLYPRSVEIEMLKKRI